MSNGALLVSQLHDSRVEVRAVAAEALCQLGQGASRAATELVKACADQEKVSHWAVAALEQLGPPPAETLAELEQLIGSRQELVAYWAVTLVGRLGTDAGSSAAALAAALTDSPHLCVNERAAWALGRVGDASPSVLAALQQASASKKPRLARLAARALEDLGDPK